MKWKIVVLSRWTRNYDIDRTDEVEIEIPDEYIPRVVQIGNLQFRQKQCGSQYERI